jgi:hypothetical protein
MTDEEQVLKSLEDLVNEAQAKMRREQTEEHQRAMPYLMAEAIKHASNVESGGIHLFAIRSVDELPDGVTPDDPFNLKDTYHQHLCFQHCHRFDDSRDAEQLMMNINSAIIQHHASEGQQVGYFLLVNDTIGLMYASAKLTVHKVVSANDSQTFTADINHDEPDDFFPKVNVTDDIKRLCAAIMFFAEGGADFKRTMPDTYELMLKRMLDNLGESDDD